MSTKCKMNWFIDKYTKGELDNVLYNTGKNIGTICVPTGGGKTGIMINYIVNVLENILKEDNDKKIIFNISAPILKLIAQLMSDLNEPISFIFKDKIENNEIKFFINSSSTGMEYGDSFDSYSFNDIDRFFKNDVNSKIAFVATCHKSLYKFVEKIDDMKTYADLYTFIDESHLTKIGISNNDEYLFDIPGKDSFESLLIKLCDCKGLFLFSATPDKNSLHIINKTIGVKQNEFIVNIRAQELIDKNIVLPPRAYVLPTNKTIKITSEHCINFMKKLIDENPEINQKILITLSNQNEVLKLRDELSKKSSYAIFSTCSNEGGKLVTEDDITEVDNIKFVQNVDNYNGHCFVLHVKQLIQGIDIRSLTSAIIYTGSHSDFDVRTKQIQIIGRVLRPLEGERGKCKNERIKKYGNILYLVKNEEYDRLCNDIHNFLIEYYGIGNYKMYTPKYLDKLKDIEEDEFKDIFSDLKGIDIDMFDDKKYESFYDITIEPFRVNMEKFVKTEIYPKYKCLMELSEKPISRKIYDSYFDIIRKNCPLFEGYHETDKVFTDTYQMIEVEKILKKLGITYE